MATAELGFKKPLSKEEKVMKKKERLTAIGKSSGCEICGMIVPLQHNLRINFHGFLVLCLLLIVQKSDAAVAAGSRFGELGFLFQYQNFKSVSKRRSEECRSGTELRVTGLSSWAFFFFLGQNGTVWRSYSQTRNPLKKSVSCNGSVH
ncbi:uncharacterized protein LOC110265858 isoform X2 [Arachis ipaensis]|uniref:uncharacterized protein LOC110265858 isoform X2 n=1 Tax=Arachis ipaensis TaxID=130454 RepID=UPI000A2B16A0|nr:uncharacterized protein LOC110265858 isoform X2 [Arachis ipaensis]